TVRRARPQRHSRAGLCGPRTCRSAPRPSFCFIIVPIVAATSSASPLGHASPRVKAHVLTLRQGNVAERGASSQGDDISDFLRLRGFPATRARGGSLHFEASVPERRLLAVLGRAMEANSWSTRAVRHGLQVLTVSLALTTLASCGAQDPSAPAPGSMGVG